MMPVKNSTTLGNDAVFLRMALELAQHGLGWTSPNPLVGCVLARDGSVIGRGFHPRDGANHAEHEALLNAGGEARGATAYTTLEPCSVESRTPSCCKLLSAAGVVRVVYGALDSDARSGGRSTEVLARQGICAGPPQGAGSAEVIRACEQLLDYYSHAQRRQQPFVHLKLALSLDGKLACANGASQWLSGPQSLGLAHYLRQKYDAILVGYRTALHDDPRLTARPDALRNYFELHSPARNPLRVVLDPRWETLPSLAAGSAEPALKLTDFSGNWRAHLPHLVIAGRDDYPRPQHGLPDAAQLLPLAPAADGQLEYAALLSALWQLGVRSLLVEGGAGVAQSLLAQRAVNKLSAVFTPRLLGGDALGFSPALGLDHVGGGMRLEDVRTEVLGDDVLLSGYPVWPD